MSSNPNIQLLHHVCLPVRDMVVSKRFYIEVLGLTQHNQIASWISINDFSAIHLVETKVSAPQEGSSRPVRHFALRVTDLASVAVRLLDANRQVFQMDSSLNRYEVKSTQDDLSFGTGTLFVEDPSGNLIEFIEIGRSFFSTYR